MRLLLSILIHVFRFDKITDRLTAHRQEISRKKERLEPQEHFAFQPPQLRIKLQKLS